jgi:hypothetical protein
MGLELNRQKTGIVCVESGESLNFLGFTFRMDRDLKGRAHRYLNVLKWPRKTGQEGKL